MQSRRCALGVWDRLLFAAHGAAPEPHLAFAVEGIQRPLMVAVALYRFAILPPRAQPQHEEEHAERESDQV